MKIKEVFETAKLAFDLRKAERAGHIFSSHRTVIDPITAFISEDCCVYEKKNGYTTDDRLIQKMHERSLKIEFVDISYWGLFTDKLYSTPRNFSILYNNNPFPNGVFFKIMNYKGHPKHRVEVNEACLEIEKVNSEYRIHIYRFNSEPIDGVGEKALILDTSHYVREDGTLKLKYISDLYLTPETTSNIHIIANGLHSKVLAFFQFISACDKLRHVLTVEDLPLEKEELTTENRLTYKGDSYRVLIIKETARVREAILSIKTTGHLPKRYHSVRGHIATSKLGKKFFRKGHFRGNKEIGEVHKIYKMGS